ncbi:unnamed protein product, partial [Allacma fusca]
NRLVGGLASEKIRWIQSVQNFREKLGPLLGEDDPSDTNVWECGPFESTDGRC